MAISAPLAPYARQWAFNLGLIVPGARLHTYAGGTLSLPAEPTWADSARTTPNANPIVASAAGLFGPIFLTPGVAYHMVLETAAGVVIWDQDFVNAAMEGGFTSAVVGPIDNLAVPAGTTLLRLNNATALALTGLAAGYDGQRVQIVSVGAGNVSLYHQSLGSFTQNRFINLVTGAGGVQLVAGRGFAEYVYDATSQRWRQNTYEQGGWIQVPYSAVNFLASGGAVWDVQAGDQSNFAYYLRGRQLFLAWRILTSSVTTAVAPVLQLKIPNAFISNSVILGPFQAAADNGGAMVAALASVSIGGTVVELFKDMSGTGAWAVSVNNTLSQGEMTFEVQ